MNQLDARLAFNVSLTQEKIVGALIHCIPYVCFPQVLNALTLVKEIVAQRAADAASASKAT
ncbi:MAG: hypothetical protein ACM3ZE_03720 [Myxococcales bacterium]